MRVENRKTLWKIRAGEEVARVREQLSLERQKHSGKFAQAKTARG
jgi:hypothetical protein